MVWDLIDFSKLFRFHPSLDELTLGSTIFLMPHVCPLRIFIIDIINLQSNDTVKSFGESDEDVCLRVSLHAATAFEIPQTEEELFWASNDLR